MQARSEHFYYFALFTYEIFNTAFSIDTTISFLQSGSCSTSAAVNEFDMSMNLIDFGGFVHIPINAIVLIVLYYNILLAKLHVYSQSRKIFLFT